MDTRKAKYRQTLYWVSVSLPLAAAFIASFLPLQRVFQQALIGVVLVWFGASILLGVFQR